MIKIEYDGHKRIYVGQYVAESSTIRQLQSQAARYISLEPLDPEKFHVTLFHYGRSDELYQSVAMRTVLSKSEFMRRFDSHLENTVIQSYFERSLRVKSYEMAVFGNDINRYLVLRLDESEKMLAFRQKILFGFTEFLRGIGIPEVRTFISNNPELKYQLQQNYKAHITIGTLEPSTVDIPKIREKYILRLEAPRLFNVSLRNEAT